MTETTFDAEPSVGAVAAAQLRMIAHLQKRDFLILAALVTALAGLSVWAQIRMDVGDGTTDDVVPIFQGLTVILAFLGAFWPLGVWRADSPERRGYFWSLPVDRRAHTLLRVGAGWVALVAVCLLVMATAVITLVPSMIRLEGLQLDLSAAWQPIATTTLAYLIVSVFVVLFESPIRWLALIWLGVLGLMIVGDAADYDRLTEGIESSVGSLFVALGGLEMAPDDSIAIWARYYVIWLALAMAGVLAAAVLRYDDR